METTLLIVTAVSLLVALAMSYTAWRLGREERRRSEARVAALSVAAGVPPFDSAQGSPEHGRGTQAKAGVAPPIAEPVAARVEPAKAPWSPSPVGVTEKRTVTPMPKSEPPAFDDRIYPGAAETRPVLGTTEERESNGGQRSLAAVAAVLLVMLLGGVFWTMTSRAPSVASAATPAPPLELVSLRHERQSSKLAVSGLVRNPVSGHPVDHLAAVVFLFDQNGSFVTSAKAPVDFVKLGSGDESPFVVSIDAPATIARYRVSFRTDEGIVPHVDKRGASPIAQGEQAASVQVK